MDEIVLITGGTGAIGVALVEQFHQSRYRTIVTCHASDQLRSEQVVNELTANGYNVALKVFDVSDNLATVNAVAEIERDLGAIKVLINAAGITRDAKLIDLTPEQWGEVLRVNLGGIYNVTRPCVQVMTSRGYGRIVNLSSVNGQRGQIGQTNYAAAKSGIIGFTKSLARETARNGITVNAVSPGYVNSPMIETVPQLIQERLLRDIPVGRFAEPYEIARVVAFLAHPESAYITGADFSINGGYHMA